VDTSLRSRSQHYSAKGEQVVFAAKIRLAGAVLGWSQTELGLRIGLTQRAIHKLEQGETEPRRKTADALEEIWGTQKIEFSDRRGWRPSSEHSPAIAPDRQR
jgi:ribosome-binding protein aMBF1 (putative translation factor)